MAAPLNDISNRLTPSVPIEITFGAQPVATGKKFTTIFGHRAASGGSALDYTVYQVVNVGDPVAAKAEVDALAGSGSQIGKMAAAFINANVQAGRSNFPAFRVVLIPNSELHFGPSSEAINAVKFLRSDMLVSCYPASDTTNRGTLLALTQLISGIDRDLTGQFGSFMTVGSLDALNTATAYAINSRYVLVGYLQDTNTAVVNADADTASGSPTLSNVTVTAGINLGATVTGTGIPAGALVGSVSASTIGLVDAAGNPVNATATASADAIVVTNQVSQPVEIVAAAHAGAMMSFGFPYIPLQGVTVGGLIQPKKHSDWIVIDPNGSSEAALAGGLSPLYAQVGGTVGFIRTRTTFTLLPDNVTPATAYFDWQELVTLNDFREEIYLVSQNPPFNNNPGGTKASQAKANLFKDEVIRVAKDFEDAEAFQDVAASAKFFQVVPSTSSRGRWDFKIPVNVLPGLMVIAGNIEAVTDLTNFTL